jgi:hypothetical protein
MQKGHITLVAGLLAAAAVFGTFAATHTISRGAAHARTSDARVLERAKALNRFEGSLHRALERKPPALPAIPKAPVARRPLQAVPQPRVVYRRPPAIVVVRHTHHGDDGGREAADGEGGGNDG